MNQRFTNEAAALCKEGRVEIYLKIGGCPKEFFVRGLTIILQVVYYNDLAQLLLNGWEDWKKVRRRKGYAA